MTRATRRLGICSWSLRPGSPEELAQDAVALGVSQVQLALDPLREGAWSIADTRAALATHGLALCSGMIATVGEDYTSLESIRRTGGLRPDEHWEANRRAAEQSAQLARELGLKLVSFHAGFLPEERDSPERARLLKRLREIVNCFAAHDIDVALETGQESARTLLTVLDELAEPNLGVNFDPANMLLYGMGDPVAALELLAPHVRQIHVKDAVRSATPGDWGEELVVGTGEVDWSAFFDVLRRAQLDVDLVIEREAGERRLADARTALELLRAHGFGNESADA